MALSERRRWTWVAIGAAAIATGYLPPRDTTVFGSRRGVGRADRSMEQRLRAIVARDHEHLIIRRRAEQLRVWIDRVPNRSLFVDPAAPDAWETAAGRLFASAWSGLPAGDDDVMVGFAVLVDTADAVPGLPRAGASGMRFYGQGRHDWDGEYRYLLPTPTHRGCVVMFRADVIRPVPNAGAQFQPSRRRALLGPCGYYGVFGDPGAEIDAWIRSHGYHLAFSTDWGGRRRRGETGPPDRWTAYGGLSHLEGRCVSRDVDACRRVVLDSPDAIEAEARKLFWRIGRRGGAWADDRPTEYITVGMRGFDPGRMREQLGHYFADLIRDKGIDRFRAFWTSGRGVEPAFLEAFGEPLGEWTARWAAFVLAVPPRGPAPKRSSVTVSLIFGLVTVLVGVGVAHRRQIN